MLVPKGDSQRRDYQRRLPGYRRQGKPAKKTRQKPAKNPPREKAGGRYATGLLLQLPAREVRFRCDSMPKV
jgi:hypothetical protein